MGMTWDALADLGTRLPEVVRDIWFRTPALKVRGKSFVRLKEDGRSVVFLLDSVDEQEFLIEARPKLYFITDHYRGYPAVLARLDALTPAECRVRLERGYRLKAPKALLKLLDGAGPAGSPTKPRPGRPATAPTKPALAGSKKARPTSAKRRSPG
jgi:hypothetical protein